MVNWAVIGWVTACVLFSLNRNDHCDGKLRQWIDKLKRFVNTFDILLPPSEKTAGGIDSLPEWKSISVLITAGILTLGERRLFATTL